MSFYEDAGNGSHHTGRIINSIINRTINRTINRIINRERFLNLRRKSYSAYSAKSDFDAPQTGHFQSFGISLNGVPGLMPPSGSPYAGS